MAITKTQSTTGNGATVALTSVASGSLLTLQDSYYRAGGSGAGETVPTDTQGTWSTASSGTPGIALSQDGGTGIFYQANVASGTHTVTPQANTVHNSTLAEWAGIATSTPFDVGANAKTNASTFTSQVTGTTATTAQADELVLIALSLGAAVGVSNVGFTNPVSGFTSLHVNPNDSTSIATFHAYKVVAATGTQAATFNWTDGEANQYAGANIATFKAAAAGGDTLMGMACL
mgnify:CR=1 FL=1